MPRVLRPRPVEREGLHPQGALLRIDQLRGQPRRGREGIILVPRRDPTGSYLKALYKYPQGPFPYQALVEENRRRGRALPEFDPLDTGAFNDSRYFDVLVEYAKASPDDIYIRITATNRGPEPAPLHL